MKTDKAKLEVTHLCDGCGKEFEESQLKVYWTDEHEFECYCEKCDENLHLNEEIPLT